MSNPSVIGLRFLCPAATLALFPMSLAQTSQLLQLLLNSALLTVVCALLWLGVSCRQSAIATQLNQLPTTVSLLHRHRLRQQYHRHYQSRVALHWALLLSLGNSLTLGLRTLIPWDGLIPLSLGLFVLSVAGLLIGLGITLDSFNPDPLVPKRSRRSRPTSLKLTAVDRPKPSATPPPVPSQLP